MRQAPRQMIEQEMGDRYGLRPESEYVDDLWDAAERVIASLQKQIKLLCDDWAEDHTGLQEMVRKYNKSANPDGDSFGVPGIGDLAEMLCDEIERLTRERDEWHGIAARQLDEAKDEITRLTRERDEARELCDKYAKALSDTTVELSDERDRLRDALRPFVALLQTHNDLDERLRSRHPSTPVFGINDATITVDDLRKARAALREGEGK